MDVSRTRDDVWECESGSSSIRMEKSRGELAFDFSCLQEDSVDEATRFASESHPMLFPCLGTKRHTQRVNLCDDDGANHKSREKSFLIVNSVRGNCFQYSVYRKEF